MCHTNYNALFDREKGEACGVGLVGPRFYFVRITEHPWRESPAPSRAAQLRIGSVFLTPEGSGNRAQRVFLPCWGGDPFGESSLFEGRTAKPFERSPPPI